MYKQVLNRISIQRVTFTVLLAGAFSLAGCRESNDGAPTVSASQSQEQGSSDMDLQEFRRRMEEAAQGTGPSAPQTEEERQFARLLASNLAEHGVDAEVGIAFRLRESTLYGFPIEQEMAESVWQAISANRESIGHTPVIMLTGSAMSISMGPDGETEIDTSWEEHPDDLAAILNRASSLDLHAVLAEMRNRQPGSEEPHSGWPEDALPQHSVNADFPGRPMIVLVPTAEPWEVFAYLKFGGFNLCPPPHEHVVMARSWSARFGAVPFLLTEDAVAFLIERPVSDRDTAVEIAREHFAYCGNGESIEHNAAHLFDSTVWQFWWD